MKTIAIGPGGICLTLLVTGCGGSVATSNPGFTGSLPDASGVTYDATMGLSGEDGGGPGSYAPNGNAGASSSGGGGTMCVSTCSEDSDCQNSCPAAASGSTNCCDTASNTCFLTPMAACPSQGVGSE